MLKWVVATALCKGDLRVADLDAEIWTCEQIRSLVSRTECRPFIPVDPHLNYSERDPDRVVVRLRSGDLREAQCSYPTGAPQAPLDRSALLAKFNANASRITSEWSDHHSMTEQLCRWQDSASILTTPTDLGFFAHGT